MAGLTCDGMDRLNREFFRFCSRICGFNQQAQAGFIQMFLALLAAACLVYARAIYFPVFGIDTCAYFNGNGNPDTVFEIIQGRWGAVALNHILGYPLLSPLLSQLFFLLALCFSMFATVMFWNGANPGFGPFCACLVMCLFPYWAGMAYFATHHVVFAISVLLSALAPILAWRRGLCRMLCATGCVALAASFYQSGVMLSASILCATCAVILFQRISGSPAAMPLSGAFRALAAIVCGGLLYIICHKLILAWFGLSSCSQGYAIGADFSLKRPFEAFRLIFPGNPFLLPLICQILPCVCLAAILAAIIRRRQPALLSAFLCSLICALAAPAALAFVQAVPVPSRAMGGLAVFWGALVFMAVSGKKSAKIIAICALAACVIFAARINYAWQIQALATDADMADARGMWTQINNLQEFSDAPKPVDVAFVGCLSKDARAWPQDWESIFGMSQFACLGGDKTWPPHPQAVMRLIGASIKWRQPEESDLAGASGRKPWPAAEAVFWNNDHAAIWLGPPQRYDYNMEPRLKILRECIRSGEGAACRNRALAAIAPGSKPGLAKTLLPCMGYVDAEENDKAMPGFKKVKGWAWNHAAKNIPAYVALLNCQGEAAGVAATGGKREDLVESLALDAEFAGFEGYVRQGEKICAFAY